MEPTEALPERLVLRERRGRDSLLLLSGRAASFSLGPSDTLEFSDQSEQWLKTGPAGKITKPARPIVGPQVQHLP
jgi:hypothetical protein